METTTTVKSEDNIIYLNYYQRNKDKILERRKEYVKNNPDKIKENNKKHYNKDYFREYYHKKKAVVITE